MRVQHKLLRGAFIKRVVAARRVLQWQYFYIYRLRDSHLVVQDSHHELPVETEHGTLTRTEAVGFSPSQTDPQAQHTLLRIGIPRTRIVRDIQSWNADRTARASHRHQRIQHGRGLLCARLL